MTDERGNGMGDNPDHPATGTAKDDRGRTAGDPTDEPTLVKPTGSMIYIVQKGANLWPSWGKREG